MLHKTTQQKITQEIQKFIIIRVYYFMSPRVALAIRVFDLAKDLAAVGVLRDGAAHTFDESQVCSTSLAKT